MQNATDMDCPRCEAGKLAVARSCRRVRMVCQQCRQEFQIHEVANRLDARAEEILSRWTAIIYD